MTIALIIQILEALANTLGAVGPLIAEGRQVLSQDDAAAVHAALLRAEASTAALRPQVDAALAAAANS